ncbi:MAG: pyridoxamine 5'-phosphate oxidase family protein [Euryarchaeota archaeon]|nr:pyridoxamine 5'-phosphate oxidase family protein [Euryarchaeota archaeon]
MKDSIEVRRYKERAHYDKETLYKILDNSLFCTISFCEKGTPFSIPMNFTRIDEYIYIHGSCETRIIKILSQGVEASVSITIPGNPVISKKLCDYSMNYSSSIIFGKFEPVNDKNEKLNFFIQMAKKFNPNDWENSEIPQEKDLENVCVLKMKLKDFSSKIRI